MKPLKIIHFYSLWALIQKRARRQAACSTPSNYYAMPQR